MNQLMFMEVDNGTINVAYITSVNEDRSFRNGKNVINGCHICMVDGTSYFYTGTKEEFFQKMRDGLSKGGVDCEPIQMRNL